MSLFYHSLMHLIEIAEVIPPAECMQAVVKIWKAMDEDNQLQY
jgi:hypothetical protein